jgi:hypothetical protein
MNTISSAAGFVPDAIEDHSSAKAVCVLSCLGLLVSLCLLTSGVDPGVAWL